MNEVQLVSVIVIFLNAERFIEEAIESVLSQTYPHWELLLVDDGSTDGSTAIARHYAERWPGRVRYLEHAGHQNRGMSASRNLGIGHARGEFIAFLDADDVWLPHKLAEQVPLLAAAPEAGMVYGATEHWYSWTGRPEDTGRDTQRPLGFAPNTLVHPPALLLRMLRREAPSPCTCSILVRRALAVELGGFEESFRGMYEDQVFYVKVGLKAPIYVSGQCWDRYRRRPDSTYALAKQNGQRVAAREAFLAWVKRYCAGQSGVDAEVHQAVRQEVWRLRLPVVYRVLSAALNTIHRAQLRAGWRGEVGSHGA